MGVKANPAGDHDSRAVCAATTKNNNALPGIGAKSEGKSEILPLVSMMMELPWQEKRDSGVKFHDGSVYFYFFSALRVDGVYFLVKGILFQLLFTLTVPTLKIRGNVFEIVFDRNEKKVASKRKRVKYKNNRN